MTRTRTIALLALASLIAALETTCGGDTPSSPSPPPGPPASSVTGLTISGDASLTAAGDTTQLTATASAVDGSTHDVTALSTWGSSDGAVITVAGGLMTAVALGKAVVEANYRGHTALLDVRVMPDGSFILSGTVTEPVDLPIDGALVEVAGGETVGPRSTVAGGGSYLFVGVSGTVTVKASRSGYRSEEQSVTMSKDRTVNLELQPTTAPAQVEGNYRLTFTASSSCGAQLPAEALKRTYTAAVEQSGAAVEVTLSGANFFENTDGYYCRAGPANHFSGIVRGDRFLFHLGGAGFYETCFSIAERLDDTRVLGIGGSADGKISSMKISGDLSGVFQIIPGSGCSADDHRFTFSK